MRAAVKRERERENEVAACAVLVGQSMPDWSVEEILAVHFRMHKAEGVPIQGRPGPRRKSVRTEAGRNP